MTDYEIPEYYGRGEYVGQMVLNPVGMSAVIVLGMALLVLHRRYATLPILIMAYIIEHAQSYGGDGWCISFLAFIFHARIAFILTGVGVVVIHRTK